MRDRICFCGGTNEMGEECIAVQAENFQSSLAENNGEGGIYARPFS